MEQHLSSKKHIRISFFEKAHASILRFTFVERVLLGICVVLLILSTLMLLGKLNAAISVEVPAKGGEVHEGIIGFPRFVNPILSLTDADRDVTHLIYSGLFKATPRGTLVPDLAESYSISEGGLIYDVVLKEDIYFHDGQNVSADDVVFTINKTLDPIVKSPKRANWEGVSVERVDDRTVRFTLIEPYAPFLENLTIGILPAHIWENTPLDQFQFSKFNTEPVGSGPYQIEKIHKNSDGIPERYTLTAFKKYALGEPYITEVTLHFFSTEEALVNAYNRGRIHAMNSVSPKLADELSHEHTHIDTYPLPRVFAVFFNQNQAPVFTNAEVREALDLAINREELIASVFGSYASPIVGPVPAQSFFDNSALTERKEYVESESERGIDAAIEVLEDNGWQKNEESGIMELSSRSGSEQLSFTLTTSSASELKRTAEYLKEEWSKIGADVTINVFDIGNLNQDVIRPRKYDALLFGEIVGRDLDLFPFWHSSQRNDPGLNVALYTNVSTDKLLEDLRTTVDPDIRREKYVEFEKEILHDKPALFLFSPDFIYVTPKNVKGLELGTVTTSAERFLNIHEWYMHTEHVWHIFAKS